MILQFPGKGKANNGKNWQTIVGGVKQYRKQISERVAQDNDIIQRMKDATDKSDTNMQSILAGASPEMQEFGLSVGYVIPKMEEYNKSVDNSLHPIQALKTGIKGLGKELLTSGVQFLAFWAASKAIEGIVKLVDSYVNAMKYAKEAAENLNSSLKELETTQKQNTKTVEEYGAVWEKLKSGVDEQGNNVSLTDDEYAQYKEAVEQIVSVIPGLASGWNENINANLCLTLLHRRSWSFFTY